MNDQGKKLKGCEESLGIKTPISQSKELARNLIVLTLETIATNLKLEAGELLEAGMLPHMITRADNSQKKSLGPQSEMRDRKGRREVGREGGRNGHRAKTAIIEGQRFSERCG